MKLRFGDAIRLVSRLTKRTLTSVSTDMGHASNWASIKLSIASIRLDTAIKIAEAFGYEVVLHPASEPLGDKDIALERSEKA